MNIHISIENHLN